MMFGSNAPTTYGRRSTPPEVVSIRAPSALTVISPQRVHDLSSTIAVKSAITVPGARLSTFGTVNAAGELSTTPSGSIQKAKTGSNSPGSPNGRLSFGMDVRLKSASSDVAPAGTLSDKPGI